MSKNFAGVVDTKMVFRKVLEDSVCSCISVMIQIAFQNILEYSTGMYCRDSIPEDSGRFLMPYDSRYLHVVCIVCGYFLSNRKWQQEIATYNHIEPIHCLHITHAVL